MIGEKPFAMDGIAELDILPSNHVLIRTTESFFNPKKEYQLSIGTTTKVYKSEEIGHIKFVNPGYNSVLESHFIILSIIMIKLNLFLISPFFGF
jgi:hypothetical protein